MRVNTPTPLPSVSIQMNLAKLQNIVHLCVCAAWITWLITSTGSTGWLSISFRTGRSSLCMVVTSPSLNLEENLWRRRGVYLHVMPAVNSTRLKAFEADLPARPAICRACDVLMVSICFSPFSLTLGFTRELKMMRFILLGTEWRTMFTMFLHLFLMWIHCERLCLQVEAHANSICSNQDVARVIRVIELFSLGQFGAC